MQELLFVLSALLLVNALLLYFSVNKVSSKKTPETKYPARKGNTPRIKPIKEAKAPEQVPLQPTALGLKDSIEDYLSTPKIQIGSNE